MSMFLFCGFQQVGKCPLYLYSLWYWYCMALIWMCFRIWNDFILLGVLLLNEMGWHHTIFFYHVLISSPIPTSNNIDIQKSCSNSSLAFSFTLVNLSEFIKVIMKTFQCTSTFDSGKLQVIFSRDIDLAFYSVPNPDLD